MLFVPLTLAVAQSLASAPCTVQLTRVTQLGSLADPVARSTRMSVARTSAGGFVLSPSLQAPQLALYSAAGEFQALYDRSGRGPGELSPPQSQVHVLGDTIFVFNANRLLTFDHSLRPIATRNLDVSPNRAVLLRDGRIVVSYPLRRPGAPGEFVHVLDATGRLVRSLDRDSTRNTSFVTRVLAPSIDGGFWVAPNNDNWLRKYSRDGVAQSELRIQRSWLKPWEGADPGPFMERPQPAVQAIQEFMPGRLLVLGHVADARWKALDREPRIDASSDINGLYDMIMEVIDTATGAVVAAGRHSLVLRLVQNSRDLVFAAVETGTGDIHAVIYRVGLDGCTR